MGLRLYLAGRSLGFYLGSLLQASSWNILIVCSGFRFFLPNGAKGKQVPGSDPTGLPTLLAASPPGQGGKTGLGVALCLPRDLLGRCWGVSQGEPCPPAWPGPRIHPQSLTKGSDQRVRARGGEGRTDFSTHRVSPSLGCYGDLKIAWAIQRGESIPFFQESEKRCSRPGNVPVFSGGFIC